MTGKADSRDELRRKLDLLLDRLDEDGLTYLLRQAAVLIRNAEVEDRQREAPATLDVPAPRPIEPARPPTPPRVALEGSGAAFFLVLGGVRKSLSRAERDRLVRIASAEPRDEAVKRLYGFLQRERKDILGDAGIRGPSHPLMKMLGALLLDTRP